MGIFCGCIKMIDYVSIEILFEAYFKPILEEMKKANDLKKNELWLLYNMHVDKLDRSPSAFLTNGFTDMAKSWNKK